MSCGADMKRDVPDMCTEEAREQGCTCTIPFASAYDIDPPEPRADKHCPLHGWAPDPDQAYDQWRDEKDERAAGWAAWAGDDS